MEIYPKKIRNIFLILGVLVYTFLLVAAPYLHNHHDACHHDDCPICQWVLVSACVFLAVPALFYFRLFSRKAVARIVTFMSTFREIILLLRSPPFILSSF